MAQVNDNSDELILGFDARDVSDQRKLEWSESRREEWLIRPDVLTPLSVDAFIWPSVTAYQTFLGQRAWVGFIQDLWSDLNNLLIFLKSHPPSDAYDIVGVVLVRRKFVSLDESLWNEIVMPTSPSVLGSVWSPVGYDVADRYLTSGLVCIPQSSPQFSRLKSAFAQKVNSDHLFDTYDDADLFRVEANHVITDHAPFFVFRIYKLR